MLNILRTAEAEYSAAFDLMRENMAVYQDRHQIPWDPDWIDTNYRGKENYSLFRNAQWIGFLSIEWLPDELFIHTLQLKKSVQGSIFGGRVFEWLKTQATARQASSIACRSFLDNPAVDLYRKLGFEICGESGVLLELRMKLDR